MRRKYDVLDLESVAIEDRREMAERSLVRDVDHRIDHAVDAWVLGFPVEPILRDAHEHLPRGLLR